MRGVALLVVLIAALVIYSSLGSIHNTNIEKSNGNTETKDVNPFVTISNGKFYLNGKVFIPKGVNYYPRDYGWQYMWENFTKIEGVIDADMARAKALGVNVVRIIIQFNAFGGGNATRVKQNLSKLNTMLSILDKYNMKAIVTLLDKESPLDNMTAQLTQVRTIVSAFKNDPRIFAWDLRNEPDHFYYSKSWTPHLSKPFVMDYLHTILNEVKKDDPNHLVTVGEYGWYLGDRHTPVSYPVNYTFNNGTYNGWTVKYGTWDASSGYLEGEKGVIKINDTSWWDKTGYTISLKMKTSAPGGYNWNVGTIRFRYINDSNYYAVMLKKDGHIELGKMQNGTWHSYLNDTYTGLNCTEWHDFKLVVFRQDIEVYVDGVKYLYYWDPNPINESGNVYGGIALDADNSTAEFDDVKVRLGPSIIEDDIFKDVDFPMFHWYDPSSELKYVLNALENHTDKPIFIEEIGLPTAGTGCTHNESSVATWLSNVLSTVKEYDNVYPMIWILNDFSPEGIPGSTDPNSTQHFFGLYRLNYTLKPSGVVFRDQFTGTQLINNAKFVSASHPEIMNCSETASVSITYNDTGDTYWNASRDYRLGSQQPHDNQIWGMGRVYMNPSTTIYPGEEYTFEFNITAPSVPGKYSFSWRMLREHVEWFGDEYDSSIKVYDPNLNTVVDDEMNTMANWSTVQGSASNSNSTMDMSANTLVVEKDKWSDFSISYRGYGIAGSNWSSGITFVKAHDTSLDNYLGFTLHDNGFAEIFYVVNGKVQHNVSYANTSFRPYELNTYYISISGDIMKVYIDGTLILTADISYYPYFDSTDYIGFTTDTGANIDYVGIYQNDVPEFHGALVPMVMLLLIGTAAIRKLKNRN